MLTYTPARQLDDTLWLLDLNFHGRAGVVASYLITDSTGHTLVETGPGSTLPALDAAIGAAGARLDDVTRLLVTHVHLDHAGAAGSLLRRLPSATLYVHPKGAAHMIDPSRLLASAEKIYGARMQSLWGAFEPCPADRVKVLEDGASVECGLRSLTALHTPGHAKHHVAFHDAERATVFTGDVGGVRLEGASYVRPPTPPPDIDIEEWHASVERIRRLAPRSLALTHFGVFDDVGRHLDELLTRLDAWTKWTAERLARGDTPRSMAEAMQMATRTELADETEGDLSAVDAEAYELATPSGMTVDGLVRYLTRRPKR